MEKHSNLLETYESPATEIVEIVSEGILCASGDAGTMDWDDGVNF